jgi:hypothetical protein
MNGFDALQRDATGRIGRIGGFENSIPGKTINVTRPKTPNH